MKQSGRTNLPLTIVLCILLCIFLVRLNCDLRTVFLDLLDDFVVTQRICNAMARLRYAVPEEVLELRPQLPVESHKHI